ncbi:cytochrome c oxidase subunit 7B, mitochondrial [Crotalus tigris]|uniref:cytochrome c oxidase subunit 7B, mitochondrial n=1 Tax=Crotalus tigris TaxID=88082 RepID=UPI00192F669F|nr:cytochrome c oxidase subunit 7B, mitochondrial [Crotalus tigris]
MFPLARRALGLSARGIQHTVRRQAHRKLEPDFHDKYGNLVLISGVAFAVGTWAYACIQLPIAWNFSPVGRLTPKEWRED